MKNAGINTIGAHWYSRKDNLRGCTEKIINFLLLLKTHNPSLFEEWYEKGFTKPEAMERRVNLEYNQVEKLLSSKGKDKDYPKISYALGLWTGHENELHSASVNFSLGSNESKFFTNNCVLKLPLEGKNFEFYQKKENQKLLLTIFNESWKPEWIQVDSKKVLSGDFNYME